MVRLIRYLKRSNKVVCVPLDQLNEVTRCGKRLRVLVDGRSYICDAVVFPLSERLLSGGNLYADIK